MFGRKKKDEHENQAGAAGLPSISVSAITPTQPSASLSQPGGAGPDTTVTPGTFRTTVRIDGPATVFDARGVPGLREEILDVVSHGGSPAEIQEIVSKAMSQGQIVSGASAAAFGAIPSAQPAEDPLDRLGRLNDLRLSGALTDAEFEAQKAKILGET